MFTNCYLFTGEGETTKQMSMEELEKESNKLARGIIKFCGKSAVPNSDADLVIMVHLPPSHKMLSTILAIWKTGASYLPIEPPAPQDRVRHILQEAKPFLIIVDSGKTISAGKNLYV